MLYSRMKCRRMKYVYNLKVLYEWFGLGQFYLCIAILCRFRCRRRCYLCAALLVMWLRPVTSYSLNNCSELGTAVAQHVRKIVQSSLHSWTMYIKFKKRCSYLMFYFPCHQVAYVLFFIFSHTVNMLFGYSSRNLQKSLDIDIN